MSQGKGGGLSGLFVKPSQEPLAPEPRPERAARQPAERPIREPDASAPPETISTLVPGGSGARKPAGRAQRSAPVPAAASPDTGPSQKVRDIVDEVRKHVPAGNATMRLIETMADLSEFIPDPNQRRAAALKTLAGQGISEKDVEAGTREVEESIDRCLDAFLDQAQTVRDQDVNAKRRQAGEHRQEAARLKLELERLNETAASLEADADQREQELDRFKNEVAAARTLARQEYGI